MEKNDPDPLHVIKSDASPAEEANDEETLPNVKDKKIAFTLPESYLLASEMKALFDEDIVTHVQGPSEPEVD